MTRLKSIKTSFTGGCVSPDLLGRGDLAAFENGALALTNVLIEPTGGVRRRPGTGFIARAPGPGRLIAFTFNTEQTHLLVLTDRLLSVFGDDSLQATLPAPWTLAQLPGLNWAQSGDVLLVCHPDVPPRRISRRGPGQWTLAQLPGLNWAQSGDVLLVCHPDVPPRRISRRGPGQWTLEPWSFAEEEGRPRIPFFRFADAAITLTPSGTTGRVRLRASAPVFTPDHEGAPLRIHRMPGRIAAVRSEREAEIDLADTLPHTDPTRDWDEAAFSPQRGWPISVAFHQDRLVIGGSRDLPNRLWLSKSGDLFNFDLGEGEDDSAIEFAILSDEVNPIRAVHSGRHLQVFTTGGEWAVTGQPLTPSAIRLDRQTRIGSVANRNIPPQEIDGGTLFAAADGSIRDFLWTDLEQSYSAADLTLTTRPILPGTVDMEFDRFRRLLLAVQADGTLAVLADGAVTPVAPVAAGRIRLPQAAAAVQAGLAFTHIIEPMPPNLLAADGQGRRARLLAVTFRLKDTPALRADLGQGPVEVPLRRAAGPALAAGPAPAFTGDRRLTTLGWSASRSGPPWRIAEARPLPFTLLSVTHEMKVND
ncbi:hypothetical protein [Niveispirillum fermenti]|uniref:hypothetical protein n=1 Tax=Niveispirillum fermenti TaxID=1233113 RepID=UPI003A8A30E2